MKHSIKKKFKKQKKKLINVFKINELESKIKLTNPRAHCLKRLKKKKRQILAIKKHLRGNQIKASFQIRDCF